MTQECSPSRRSQFTSSHHLHSRQAEGWQLIHLGSNLYTMTTFDYYPSHSCIRFIASFFSFLKLGARSLPLVGTSHSQVFYRLFFATPVQEPKLIKMTFFPSSLVACRLSLAACGSKLASLATSRHCPALLHLAIRTSWSYIFDSFPNLGSNLYS